MAYCRVVCSYRTGLAIVGAILWFAIPLWARAATQYWKVASGNWNTAGNWSNALDLSTPGAVPVGGDTANIWNNDATNRTITLNVNVASALAALNIANIGAGTSTFAQGNFNLASVNESVGGRGNGNGARGAHTQSGGTNTVSGFLAVGDVTGSTGTYTMTGGAANIGGSGLYVGNNGTGTFTQSGTSAVTTTGTTPVYIGFNPGASGTYNHNGGTLTVGGTMFVGRGGAGAFNQTAGTATLNGDLHVANTTNGSSGSVTVGPNATLVVNGETVLGGSVPGNAFGPGSLTVQGDVTLNNLMIHQSGTLNLVAGGTLTVQNFVRRPPNSTFNWTGGTLNVPSVTITHATDATNFGPFRAEHVIDQNVTLNVANSLGVGTVGGATGTLTQNTGTVTVGTPTTPGALNIGLFGLGGGTYTLANTGAMTVRGNVGLNFGSLSVNGGTMTVTGGLTLTTGGTLNVRGGSLSIAGGYESRGNPTQTGGTMTVSGNTTLDGSTLTHSGGAATFGGTLHIYGGGRINLSDTAQITANGKVTVGNASSNGTLSISGGTMTVNNLLESARVSSAINLSGGSLTANQLSFIGPLTQTGGTLNAGTVRNTSATFNLSGGTATVGTELDLLGGMTVSGTGTLQVNGAAYLGGDSTSVGGAGSLAINPGGAATVTGALTAYTGPVQVSGGTLTVGTLHIANNASYTQSSGTLNASAIVASGAQDFTFNGGAINLANGSSTLQPTGLTVGNGTNAATLSLQNATVNNGQVTVPSPATLSGTGTVSAGVTSSGLVAPGTPGVVGTLTFTGPSTFNAPSTTRIKLTTATTGDRIAAGEITLGGTLELASDFGFAPPLYSSQRVISATSVTGHFDQLAGNLNPTGRWLAVTYDATGVVVTAALGGDANLDRAVDFTDLVVLAQNYNEATGRTWSTGDFNGSGGVDFGDLVLLAQTYGGSAPADVVLPAGFAADWALARSAVPEPGALVLGAVVAPLLRRRRRA